MPESLPAVELYLRSQTQWVYSGMGVRTGLNYVGVDIVQSRMPPPDDPAQVFEGLQVIEQEMLNTDRERREQEQEQKQSAGPKGREE